MSTSLEWRCTFLLASLLWIPGPTESVFAERSIVTRSGAGPRTTHEADLTQIERQVLQGLVESAHKDLPIVGLLYLRGSRVYGTVAMKEQSGWHLRHYFADTLDRYYVRTMSKREAEEFMKELRSIRPHTLNGTGDEVETKDGAITYVGTHGARRLFFRIDRDKVTRVHFNMYIVQHPSGVPEGDQQRYERLEQLFIGARRREGAWRVEYPVLRRQKDVRILFGHPDVYVTHVWVKEDRIGCVTRGRWIAGMGWSREARKWSTFSIPRGCDVVETPMNKTWQNGPKDLQLDDAVLSQVRTSSDGRWSIGVEKRSLALVCYDHELKRTVSLPDELAHGGWFPLYYCRYRHDFVLGRMNPTSLQRRHFEMRLDDYAFQRDVVEIRFLRPPGTKGPFPRWEDLSRSFRKRVIASGDVWFQPLPIRLQQRSPDGRTVWLAVPRGSGTIVIEFDLRDWRERWRCKGLPFRVETGDMWVDDVGKRVLVAVFGDVLELSYRDESR